MTNGVRHFVIYARAVLLWNVFVVLWGAFVRASGSGAGCGEHWPLCNGAVVPPSPALATIIEFMHRITSGVALIGVVVLVVWATRLFPKGHRARRYSWASLGLIIVEALLGAGLVLLAYVDKNASAGRAVYLCLHLTNTLLLLAALAASSWFAHRPGGEWRRVPRMIWTALAVALLASLTGVIAALGDTIWPAVSLAEGMRAEFARTAPVLLRLRLVHPVVASAAALFLLLTAFLLLKGRVKTWLAALVVAQLAAGGINIVLLAPVWMQILHLALAVCVWLWLVTGALEASSLTAGK
ncbi:MAG TPA: COX15/CtaA family protein [Paludibaculum sp.]|jgi:heme A synthase